MKNIKIISILLLSIFLSACGGGGGGNNSSNNSNSSSSSGGTVTTPIINTSVNAIPIVANGGMSGSYINALMGSINICQPNTQNCYTVNNVLFDTGSEGVRILASALPANFLNPIATTNGNEDECAAFADGVTFGDVALAQVQLGGLTSSSIPIQIIGQSSYSIPTSCSNMGTSMQTASTLGANGIVGIGPFQEDCGSGCALKSNNNYYYSCQSGTGCSSIAMPTTQQVTNPIIAMPTYNNGTVISLPNISISGVNSVNGYIYMGIGSATNNTYTVNVIPLNSVGQMNVNYKGTIYPNSFVDSGSSVYGLIDSTMNTCSVSGNNFFCPGGLVNIPIVASDTNNVQNISSQITVNDATTLLYSGNIVFNDLATPLVGTLSNGVDLGLSFFFGKNIITGINGKTSNFGVGPYVGW
jgi:hypothetical protein